MSSKETLLSLKVTGQLAAGSVGVDQLDVATLNATTVGATVSMAAPQVSSAEVIAGSVATDTFVVTAPPTFLQERVGDAVRGTIPGLNTGALGSGFHQALPVTAQAGYSSTALFAAMTATGFAVPYAGLYRITMNADIFATFATNPNGNFGVQIRGVGGAADIPAQMVFVTTISAGGNGLPTGGWLSYTWTGHLDADGAGESREFAFFNGTTVNATDSGLLTTGYFSVECLSLA
jgi:hypothetical protein